MATLLPYACVSDFLNNDTLVQATRESPRSVHECVLEIFNGIPTESSTIYAPARLIECSSCMQKTNREVDEKESNEICVKCGACYPFISESNRNYEATTGPDRPAYAREGKLPSWLKHVGKNSDEYRRHRLEKEIEHWRAHSTQSVPSDEIPRLVALAMIPKQHGDTIRVVAAILFDPIRAFFDLNDLERRIKGNLELPIMPRPEQPTPVHTCESCGLAMYEKWEMRRHRCFRASSLKRARSDACDKFRVRASSKKDGASDRVNV